MSKIKTDTINSSKPLCNWSSSMKVSRRLTSRSLKDSTRFSSQFTNIMFRWPRTLLTLMRASTLSSLLMWSYRTTMAKPWSLKLSTTMVSCSCSWTNLFPRWLVRELSPAISGICPGQHPSWQAMWFSYASKPDTHTTKIPKLKLFLRSTRPSTSIDSRLTVTWSKVWLIRWRTTISTTCCLSTATHPNIGQSR